MVQNPFNDRSKDTGLSSVGVESRAVLPNFTGIVSIGYITEQTIRGYSRYHVTRSGARGGGWVQILLYYVIIEDGAYLSHRYIGVMHFSCESILIFEQFIGKTCINIEKLVNHPRPRNMLSICSRREHYRLPELYLNCDSDCASFAFDL